MKVWRVEIEVETEDEINESDIYDMRGGDIPIGRDSAVVDRVNYVREITR